MQGHEVLVPDFRLLENNGSSFVVTVLDKRVLSIIILEERS